MAMACASVIVPLAISDPSGPQPGILEALDATAVVLANDAGAPTAAWAVALPPPARRPAAARPASSFLFMVAPPVRISLFSHLTKELPEAWLSPGVPRAAGATWNSATPPVR